MNSMKSIDDILKRNHRVEMEKAWVTSGIRRGVIALITYSTACVFLKLIGNDTPFLNALVPFGGYLFSTMSLPIIKSWWIHKYQHNQKDTPESYD